jgi:hypothetical protein
MQYKTNKAPADNLRFGATAAGRADLKGGGGMPPLRQAAGSLYAIVAHIDQQMNHKCSKFQQKF